MSILPDQSMGLQPFAAESPEFYPRPAVGRRNIHRLADDPWIQHRCRTVRVWKLGIRGGEETQIASCRLRLPSTTVQRENVKVSCDRTVNPLRPCPSSRGAVIALPQQQLLIADPQSMESA